MTRTLLILDLDETLVYAGGTDLPRADFEVGPYRVAKRPFVGDFLQAVAAWYDLAVWTSAGADYAAGIVAAVFGDLLPRLKFVWCRDRCTRQYDPDTLQYCETKRLQKLKRLGYRLEGVLVVDDSPEKHRQNYGNLVRVTPFLGDPADDELRRLLPFLERLKDVPDVRAVEKRGWRAAGLRP